jgi:hypothetical protein
MAYSAKKYRTVMGSMFALAAVGFAVIFWLARNHTDPISVGMFRVALALVVIGLAVLATSYRDELQRQAAQKRWFLGSMIGIAAMIPVVVSLQTHKIWLDAAVQLFFHHPAIGPLYFSLGVMTPVMFQAASVLVLRLLDKLSQGSRS